MKNNSSINDKIKILENKIEIKFKNFELITNAFVHRSYLNESKAFKKSNETLEFIGDSILSFIVSLYLYQKYPQYEEGDLTNFRSSIVKTETLAQLASELGLNEILFLSKGEENSGGRKNVSILADVMEAFLGSLYLDQGLSAVKNLLNTFLIPKLNKIIENQSYKDSKSLFQEKVQNKFKVSPHYKVLNEKGPDHAKLFTIGVYVNNILVAQGEGKNKQNAEEIAARLGLEKWTNK